MSETPESLRTLVQQGIDSGRWEGVTSCARVIGVPRGTLGHCLRGEATAETFERMLGCVRAALVSPPGKRAPPSAPTIPDLYERGKKAGAWFSFSDCAAKMRVDRRVLTQLVKGRGSPKTLRGKKFCERLIRRMKRALKPPKSPTVSAPCTTVTEDRLRQILHEELQRVAASVGTADSVIAGTWFNALLAGIVELPGQTVDGVRFVLTAARFRKLRGHISAQEIRDTQLLIEELRRRLALVAQIEDEDVRREFTQQLGNELDQLFNAIELVSSVVPTEAAKRLEGTRTLSRELTQGGE